VKRLLALTFALILLCGSALAAYNGDNYYMILFDAWMRESGLELSAIIEIDGSYICARSGIEIMILMDNGVPYDVTATAQNATEADAMLIAYIASLAFCDSGRDPMPAYLDYRKTGKGYAYFNDNWCYIIKTDSDGYFTCELMKVKR
jgi:hypothetical protein